MGAVAVAAGDAERATTIVDRLADAFAVRTARTWAELQHRLEGVDVVIVDRSLPDLSAEEVIGELRQRGHGMPVAVVDDHMDEDDPDPFDAHVAIETDPEALVETVRLLASQARFEERTGELFRRAAHEISRDEGEQPALLTRGTEQALGRHGLTDDQPIDVTGPQTAVTDGLDDAETTALLAAIDEHTLPDDLASLVAEYQELESARPPFMWKWVHRLAPQNSLPCVESRFVDAVAIDKTLTILFITILDDTLEKHRDRETFDELAQIPTIGAEADPNRADVDGRYVMFAQRVWDRIMARIERAPHLEVYEELYRFDVRQAIEAIEYSDVAIRRPDLATVADLERYESHNMVMLAYADLDLMHSPLAVRDELPIIRSAVWTAQLMARIGNWVSTWERELAEGDLSSGPVVYAVNNGIIGHEELQQAVEEGRTGPLIDRINDHEVDRIFLRRWQSYKRQLHRYNDDLSSFDLEPFIDGTEEVLRYHLASTGLK